jgi:hypothetical protein
MSYLDKLNQFDETHQKAVESIKKFLEPHDRYDTQMNGLVEWMLYRVYSSEDMELYNPQKAAIHEAKFIAEFGRKASTRNESWMRNGRGVSPDPIA